MRIFLFASLLSLLSAVAFIAPATIDGGAQAATNKPLMVIRFNQSQVLYQKAMYRAVSEALKAKPSVHFELVSFMPTHAVKPQQLGQVVQTLRQMGVTDAQFYAHTQPAPHGTYEEIHMYVK